MAIPFAAFVGAALYSGAFYAMFLLVVVAPDFADVVNPTLEVLATFPVPRGVTESLWPLPMNDDFSAVWAGLALNGATVAVSLYAAAWAWETFVPREPGGRGEPPSSPTNNRT